MRTRCVSIGVRYGDDLTGYGKQTTLERPTATTTGVAGATWGLLAACEPFLAGPSARPIRALHVRASGLERLDNSQLSLFDSPGRKIEEMDFAIDDLLRRYGNTIVRRGIEMTDASIDGLDIKDENTVHPVDFFHV